ncbi:hypothetical protein IX49_11880 [Cellulophaga lytica]|uniref:DUF1232 domain-containing protein n=1 Tax=Cellulophaga lytica (strain ATCC 23178 / DSM 7489 / JCM 8516 / NBRC 14961 / NCIMB 1423 / VKM B-1433 / Cy l20) TaxID=867900 RepID=F0RGZ2_CELLC|nr:DUF1232 domain-containing protein [Cellulophaga lytica]ADY30196.1 hypothetical protein Celly_2379 [Cellulophaga lytica DSM 7489]AIM61190.1 hypothetical protein IX49_11880 [Cellulophaga lytica]WQG78868.1 DUF1232 domain-containing protein [Cellulophaga lytica]
MKTTSFKKFKFEDLLLNNTRDYQNKHSELIRSAPYIYQLLTSLLDVTDLSVANRSKIFTSIGYFLVPKDLYSEDEHGAIGYIDDILLAIFVIKEVETEIGFEQIERLYNQDLNNLDELLNSGIYDNAIKDYDELFQEVLEFVGFY